MDAATRLVGLGPRAYATSWWNLYDIFVIAGTFSTTLPLLAFNPSLALRDLQKVFLVAICFKLFQKIDTLNQLFKVSVASLPSIGALFSIWIVLFIVWDLMFLEIFGLTRWGANETTNINFSTFWKSFVFLSFMSTGENWNQFMHDYTLDPPFCLPSSNYLTTDCGSSGWAYALFIGWNIISMYIFLNFFTGTIVEAFSYVFHLGGKPLLSRRQVRDFKMVWSSFDTQRTGYISVEQVVPFLCRLRGQFEVKSHPGEASLSRLLFKAYPAGKHTPAPHGHGDAVDLGALRQALDKLNVADIRTRRARLERMYHEARLIASKTKGSKGGSSKGVPFTQMLLMVSTYCLIDEVQALEIKDVVKRKETLERVEEAIATQRVKNLFRTSYLRRRFLARRRGGSHSHSVPPTHDLHPAQPSHTPGLLLGDIGATGSDADAAGSGGFVTSPTRSLASPTLSAGDGFEHGVWNALMRRLSDSGHGRGEESEAQSPEQSAIRLAPGSSAGISPGGSGTPEGDPLLALPLASQSSAQYKGI